MRENLIIDEHDKNFKVLFNNNPQPMWIVEIETLKFLAVNEAAIKKYGYSREEFLNITITQIRPPEENESMNNLIKRLKDSQTVKKDITHIKKDGSVMFVNITAYTVDYLSRKCRMVIINDITAQKKDEATINSKNKSLEEIGYINSHLIRKPLVNILGIIYSLEDEIENNEHLKQSLDMLKRSALELDNIIKEINLHIEG